MQKTEQFQYLFINIKKKVIIVFLSLSLFSYSFYSLVLPTFKVFKYWSVLYYVCKRTFYSILICFVSKKQRCSEAFYIYNTVESSSPIPFLLFQLQTFSYIEWNNTQARLTDCFASYRSVKYYIIPLWDKIKSYILLQN